MLHNLPAIRDSFHVYINGGSWVYKSSFTIEDEDVEIVKSVMLINYVLFEYVLKFSSKNPALQSWPTIELADRSFHPILEWTEISTRKSMGEELDQHPGRVVLEEKLRDTAAAVNSHRDVIGVVSSCSSIYIISRTGKIKTAELPDPKEFDNVAQDWIEALAVDKNDKVYVLRTLRTRKNFRKAESQYNHALSILDENYNVIHTCPLDFLEVIHTLMTMTSSLVKAMIPMCTFVTTLGS